MIYVDMDGVLCDLVKQVERFSGTREIYNKHNYGRYRIQEATQDISSDELFDYFSMFEFWSTMPELPWAPYLMSRLQEIGDKVYILSRPWLREGTICAEACIKGKTSWLAKYFPDYLGKFLLVDRKEDFAEPKSILIDDNFENCQSFADAGGKTIFLPTPWGDLNYGRREATGFDLVRKVLECELKTVENM